jgi:hypothetical protein
MSNVRSGVVHAGGAASRGVCYCDLDGVFAPYPECWLEFIESRTGKRFESLDRAKQSLCHADYVKLKSEYRSSDFKYELTPRTGSSEFTRFLSDGGWFVSVATTRPAGHRQLAIRTVRWLDRNAIHFDDILFCETKVDVIARYPELVFGVEDEAPEANMVASLGYRIFLLSNPGNTHEGLHRNVSLVKSFEDIMEVLKRDPSADENLHRQ